MIEEHHVLPGECLQTDVAGVVLHIFGNVRVICRSGFDLKRLRCQQSRQPYNSRGADLHFGEALFLDVLQQFQKWRKANLKPVIFREIEISNCREYFEPTRFDELPDVWLRAISPLLLRAKAGNDREVDTAPRGFGNHAFYRYGNAVDFKKRVGQQCKFSRLSKSKRFTDIAGDKAV